MHIKLATTAILLLPVLSVIAYSDLRTTGGDVPFAEYADSFLKTCGQEEVVRDESALLKVLEESYVAVQIGLFDVWHPRTPLRDGDLSKQFKGIAKALLDLQEEWIDWVAEEEIKKGCLKDLKTFGK